MATITVTTALDETTNNGATSLREAIALANATAGADNIVFDPTVFSAGVNTPIRLTLGQIEITDAVTITGATQGIKITGDANGDDALDLWGYTDVGASLAGGNDRLDDNSRIFSVVGAASAVTLDHLFITGGRTTVGGSESAMTGAGGAIRSDAALTILNGEVSGNSTSGDYSWGGAIFTSTLRLENATIANNRTDGFVAPGGGFYASGAATLVNATVAFNETHGDISNCAGGLAGALYVDNSTVTGNVAYNGNENLSSYQFWGAGIGSDNATIVNSILAGNVTGNFPNGPAYSDQPALYIQYIYTPNQDFRNSVIGGDPANIFQSYTSLNYGGTNGSLFATATFGDGAAGTPRTIPILPGGPAFDTQGTTSLTVDARGAPRVVGAGLDLGAAERQDTLPGNGPLVVNTASDRIDDTDGVLSLREALIIANRRAGTDVITFDSRVFNGEASDVIRLVHGQLNITDSVTIDAGSTGVVISADARGDDVTTDGLITNAAASLAANRLGDNTRVVSVSEGLGPVTLAGLTLTGGFATETAGGSGAYRPWRYAYDARGAAIWSLSDLTLRDVNVLGTAGYYAAVEVGSIEQSSQFVPFRTVTADLTLEHSRISNMASAGGPVVPGAVDGVGVHVFGDLAMAASLVSDNYGRGIQIDGDATINDSTISGNGSNRTDGGGILSNRVTLTNSTVAGNRASSGGGIYATSATLINSTVTGNTLPVEWSSGFAVDFVAGIDAVDISLVNSIVAANYDFQDDLPNQLGTRRFGVTPTLVQSNSIVAADGSGLFAKTVQIASGIRAGATADNGGPVPTVALLASLGNPALDAAGAGAPASDARGVARVDALPGGGIADIGAFELQALPSTGLEAPSLIVTTAADLVDPTDGVTSLREAVLLANSRAGADTITFDSAVFSGDAASTIRLTNGALYVSDALTVRGAAAGVRITGDRLGDDLLDPDGFTDVLASSTANRLLDDADVFAASDVGLTLEGLVLTGGRISGHAALTIRDSELVGLPTRTTYYANGPFEYVPALSAETLTLDGVLLAPYGAYAPRQWTGEDSEINFNIGRQGIITNSTLVNVNTFGYTTFSKVHVGLGNVQIDHSTLMGGVYINPTGNVTISNSIVTSDSDAPDFTAPGPNLIGVDARDVFAETRMTPSGSYVGVLADNGGPTRTAALLASEANPAIDAAGAGGPATDARGLGRVDLVPGGGIADLGAFELQTFGRNAAPTVTGPVVLPTGAEDTAVSITAAQLLGGASDANGDALSVIDLNVTTGGGTLTATATGWTYSPAPDYFGAVGFSFNITDGRLSVAQTASLDVAAVNDAPTLVPGSTTATGVLTERAGTTGASTLNTTSGTITFADVDLADVHLVSQASPSFVWSAGALSTAQQSALAAAGTLALAATDSTGAGAGTVAWSYSAPDKTFDFLAQGATLKATYNVTIDDNHGGKATQAIALTVIGANDVAAISGTAAGTVKQDVSLSAQGQLAVGDPDAGQNVFQPAAALGGTYGTFTFDPASGKWTYALANTSPAVRSLAAGQQVTDTLVVRSLDGTATQPVTVAVAGTNHAPALGQQQSKPTVAEGQTVRLATVSDADPGDLAKLTINITPANADATPVTGYLQLDPVTGALTYTADGYNPQRATDAFSYVISDSHGATASGLATVTVTPTATLTTQVGSSGADTLAAAKSSTRLIGGDGSDTFAVNASKTLVFAGRGNDTVNVDAGQATVYGGPGVNTINLGSTSRNTIVLQQGGLDHIYGFNLRNGDQLDLTQILAESQLAASLTPASLGQFFGVAASSSEATLTFSSAANAASAGSGTAIAVLHDVGPSVTLQALISNAALKLG